MSSKKKRLSPQTVERRLKAKKAVELRLAGASYGQIAERLGVTPSGAWRMVARELERVEKGVEESAKELRRMELMRLDRMMLGLWQDAITGNAPSVDRILRIMERRAQILGIDAPDKHEVEIVSRQELEEKVRRLVTRTVVTETPKPKRLEAPEAAIQKVEEEAERKEREAIEKEQAEALAITDDIRALVEDDATGAVATREGGGDG